MARAVVASVIIAGCGSYTGCTMCDLADGLTLYVAAFERMSPEVVGPLLADCADDRDLRDAFMRSLFDPPRKAVGRTLDGALERGDLRADTDRDLILDLLGSLVHYRALFGHAPTSDAEIERAVQTLLQGVATDYDSLLEHALAAAGDPRIHHRHAGPH